MNFLTYNTIASLGITSAKCVEWAKHSLLSKPDADLPPKTWQHFPGDVFFNTMPCVIPAINRYAVKMVSRHPGQNPALKSTILLADTTNGDVLACMDGIWITAWRTGAVAALAGKTFTYDFEHASFGFVGLGNMAHTTFECLQSQFSNPHDIWLLRYKDQAEQFIEHYANLPNIRFHLTNSRRELVENTNALYSCVTVMNEQFLSADTYPSGYTLIPVHMRGFQDCDVVFDRIFGDDRGYLTHFQHFNEFKYFGEFTEVLAGRDSGRRNGEERLICYNIGLALHDCWFASRIYDIVHNNVNANNYEVKN